MYPEGMTGTLSRKLQVKPVLLKLPRSNGKFHLMYHSHDLRYKVSASDFLVAEQLEREKKNDSMMHWMMFGFLLFWKINQSEL